MKLLITGGAGFIGSHVAELALARGHAVAVLDDLSTGHADNVPPGAEFFRADIRDRAAVGASLARFRPDVVSHHAAQASVVESVRDPRRDAEINFLGGLNVLEAARECGVRQFVFASTGGALYGDVPVGRRAETSWPADPWSPYAADKLAFEHHLRTYRQHQGMDCRVLRYANVYGPRQDAHGEAGVVAIFLGRLLQEAPIRIFACKVPGDGGCTRDYVYVGDVARANLAVLEGKISRPTVHVATGRGTSTIGIARKLEELLGVRARVEQEPPRPGDVANSVLDPEDLEETIGPLTSLEAGLASTVRWYQDQSSKENESKFRR